MTTKSRSAWPRKKPINSPRSNFCLSAMNCRGLNTTKLTGIVAFLRVCSNLQHITLLLESWKYNEADKHHCDSDDTPGVRKLLNSTLELIADDRVRLFAVAAQVVDVEQKIDSAITECMRLGTHAIRTALVPLPFTSAIGTPTVARILCEHVLQCFGFPKAMPDAVEEIMNRVVLGHLKAFMAVTVAEFLTVGLATTGLVIGTMGAGAVLGLASCILAAPPTARMLFKCACDMILILERSFRYRGKYVSVKQIEDAAVYYTTATTKTFAGKELLLQKHVHDSINKLIPLHKVGTGFRFGRLRPGLEEIIYNNRFEKKETDRQGSTTSASLPTEIAGHEVLELDAGSRPAATELPAFEKGAQQIVELPAEVPGDASQRSLSPVSPESDVSRLRSSTSTSTSTHLTGLSPVSPESEVARIRSNAPTSSSPSATMTTIDELLSKEAMTDMSKSTTSEAARSQDATGSASPSLTSPSTSTSTVTIDRTKSESLFSRGTKKLSRFGLKKSTTNG